jgi:ABC-type Mn2+/Zn2+ transport system ATPase subunit
VSAQPPRPAAAAGAAGAAGEPPPPVLATDALAAGYGGPPVLTDVTFSVRPGQRVAVLGPNGGGKTTLFRTLLRELRPQAGSLTRPARIGVVPQTERSRLDFPVSALDVALMGTLSTLPWWRRPGRADRERARRALADVGLGDRAGRSFGDLSGGQRQRVLVARALVQDAPVLLLDEPYVGLDGPSVALLDDLLADLTRQGRALLIATHDIDQARGWERVLCLNRRQVAFGAPAATLTRAVLEATYGAEIVDLPGERCVLPPHHHEHA